MPTLGAIEGAKLEKVCYKNRKGKGTAYRPKPPQMFASIGLQLWSTISSCKDLLLTNNYVDDILTGTDSKEEILVWQKELIALLNLGVFELKKVGK